MVGEKVRTRPDGFKPSKHTHSAWAGLTECGWESCKSDVCYSGIWGVEWDTLALFIGEDRIDVEEQEDYVNWFLNESQWADAFLTKSYKEGIENGFRVDVDKPGYFVKMALIGFRNPFEMQPWGWKDFKEMGYSNEDAYVLAINYQIDEEDNTFWGNRGMDIHFVLEPGFRYDIYLKAAKHCLKYGDELFSDGDYCGTMFGLYAPNLNYRGYKTYELNKSTVDTVLREMKEK